MGVHLHPLHPLATSIYKGQLVTVVVVQELLLNPWYRGATLVNSVTEFGERCPSKGFWGAATAKIEFSVFSTSKVT